MKLTVIIPVYNEHKTIASLLGRVLAIPIDKEVLVVDDGSDDDTGQKLREVVTDEVQLFVHPQNRGKGAAICTALEHATGDAVIIQDADFEYFPEDYVALLEVYKKKQARAVFGVRDLSQRSYLMRYGNNFVTWVTNRLFGTRLDDMETCYKLIERELFQSLQLTSRRFEIEAEITAKLARSGIEIHQTPIRYEHRDEGKKLTPLDGLPTLLTLFKYRSWQPPRAVATTS